LHVLLLVVPSAQAGVWVHRPGTGYAQVGFVHQQSSRVFLADTTLVPQTDEALIGHLSPLFGEARYSADDVSLYLELGVLPGLEIMGSLPHRSARNRWTFAEGDYGDIVHRNRGFSDPMLGLRAGGILRGVALSGFVAGRAPLYDNSPEALNMEVGNADFEDDLVPLGRGTMELDVGGGAGVGNELGWTLLDVGLRLRDRHYSSSLPLRLQVGAKPLSRLSAWLSLDAEVSLADGSAPDDFLGQYGKGPLVVDAQSLLQGSLGASVDLVAGVGVRASVHRTLTGARFPQLTTISAGIYSNFRMPWVKEGS
jgi:hypothetical protein